MIILDTHIWVWWVHGDHRLSPSAYAALDSHASSGIVISAISFWEVALLITKQHLRVAYPLEEWIERAATYPGIRIQPLTHTVCVDACTLPGAFHNDPADRFLVATARELRCPLITEDARILDYHYVNAIAPENVAVWTSPPDEEN